MKKIISSQIFDHNIIFSDSSGTAIKSCELEYSSWPNFFKSQSVSITAQQQTRNSRNQEPITVVIPKYFRKLQTNWLIGFEIY